MGAAQIGAPGTVPFLQAKWLGSAVEVVEEGFG
jgi:hypothetical protein